MLAVPIRTVQCTTVQRVSGRVSIDSVIGQDSEEAEAAATDVKLPSTSVQGSQGQRVAKAVTKLEEKKQKRVTRQEQVFHVCA